MPNVRQDLSVTRTPKISIGNRAISADHSTYVIAEVGVNHNGDPAMAHELIDTAKRCDADAVKFQTFRADQLSLSSANKADYQRRTTGQGGQLEMLRALELPNEVFIELRDHCKESRMDFISSAFERASLEFVASLEPACLKWPSGEINNWPLLRQARSYKMPVLLSTGMARMAEVAGALEQLGPDGNVVVMQCVSDYPSRIGDQNLRTLVTLRDSFNVPTGFSDHTIGPHSALVARALGMSVLEKHITFDRTAEGPDHAASMEPQDFHKMVALLREVEQGLGDGVKAPRDAELSTLLAARKSLVYANRLTAGKVLTDVDLVAKRPAGGVPPDLVDIVVGRTLASDVDIDTMVALSDLA